MVWGKKSFGYRLSAMKNLLVEHPADFVLFSFRNILGDRRDPDYLAIIIPYR